MKTKIAEIGSPMYDARRRRGGFTRHAIETTLPDGRIATFTGGAFRSVGTITISGMTYKVGRASMSDDSVTVAEYSIHDRFMRMSIARLHDVVQGRHLLLRQRRCWSSTLVLFESDIQVGVFQSDFFQSRYRVSVNEDISPHVVLLCLWIAMIRGAFTA